MTYDIITIDKWEAPPKNGVALLTSPNIALPCHGLCPRTIEGQNTWNKMRRKCYEDANYCCEISGAELGKGHVHAHEIVSIDWANQTETFNRIVALDPRIHTRFIHSGRAITLFERGDRQMKREHMLETLEQCFSLISSYNLKHYDEESLRVFDTILDWAKNPQLERDVNRLIEKYKIKFYTFDKKYINNKYWSNWKLVYNGDEYPTKFANQKEWEEYYKPKPVKKVEEDNLSILDTILKEEE